MLEPVSALAGETTPRAFGPDLALAERRIGPVWQLAAWPDRLPKAAAAVAAAAGVKTAPGPLRAVDGGGKGASGARLLRVEPLKWWLVTEASSPPDTPDAPDMGGAGAVLDLSHSWTVIRVEGARAPDLMARAAPLDLRPRAFPEGSVATSAIHHVSVTVDARAGGFDLYCPRGFALSLWEHLCEIAEQFAVS